MVQSEQVPNSSEHFEKVIFMIKLQDFARECGVTDRAIQKHLKTYAEELEGLYQRKGPNGTWLTDEACEILRSKMKQQPIVVGDGEIYRKNEELRQKVEVLQEKLILAHEKIADQQLQLDQGKANQLMLQAAEEQAKKATEDLAAVHQQLGAARQEAQDLKQVNDQQAQDLAAARAEADAEHLEAARLRAELEDRKAHPWKYLFRRGKENA